MAKAKSHIPDGFQSVVPYFHVNGAADFLGFIATAFGARETHRSLTPDGKIMHASARIGDAMIEVADASAEWPAMPCAIHLYLPDTDAAYARAMGAGATSLYAPADMFYGERSAGITDPFGNKWYIATHTEDLSEAEMDVRAQENMRKLAQQSQQQ